MIIKNPVRILCLLISLELISCESKVKFEKVAESEVDPIKLEQVTNLSKSILTAQKEGGYYQLTEEEATADLIKGLTEQLQKTAYQQITSNYGNYEDITFDHLMKPTDGRLVEIYRFKGVFGSGALVEVRAVLGASGKLAGFFVKPWNDNP